MIRSLLTTFFATMVCLAVSPAIAQHSDVEFGYANGSIIIEGGQASNIDASLLFEADFPVDGLSQNFTEDPGFASELAEGLGIVAGDDIFINFLNSATLFSSQPVTCYVQRLSPDLNLVKRLKVS